MDGGLYPKKQRTKVTNENAAGINVICSEMIEVFKTNVLKKSQSKMLLCILSEAFPSFKINFDLSDCDKVLRVEGDNMEALPIMDTRKGVWI